MVLYDFSNLELFVCGDIHGDFNRFFYKIKENIDVEEDKHTTKKRNKLRTYAYKGKSFNNSIIVVNGDCGIGFNKEQYYIDLFAKHNELFEKSNTVILFVRGNHDDKSYFNDERLNFSHIKAISDYSVIKSLNHVTLCVGGGISVDRTWRKQQEAIINKYKGSEKKKIYWEDEICIFDEEKLNEIVASGLKIDSVISHSSPSFAKPDIKDMLLKWFRIDNQLKNDIEKEREALSNVFDFLIVNGYDIKFWSHGHFHSQSFYKLNRKEKDVYFFSLSDDMNIKNVDDTIIEMIVEEEMNSKIMACDWKVCIPNDYTPIDFDDIDREVEEDAEREEEHDEDEEDVDEELDDDDFIVVLNQH